MSTSGRYQSRVLSFFSQQSLRLRDQAGQALRQLKMVAVLGAQIVLYPVYVAFQTGRLLDRQIQQATQRIFPQLQAAGRKNQNQSNQHQKDQHSQSASIDSDTPIQKTLQAIQNLRLLLPSAQVTIDPLEGTIDSFSANALTLAAQHEQIAIAVIGLPTAIALPPSNSGAPPAAIAPTNSSLPASPPAIDPLANTLFVQGIASMLTTQHLVLVTNSNEVLDVLTAEQRSQLQKYIVWEVANYWRQQQQRGLVPLRELSIASRTATFLPLPKIRATQLPPIRFFRQLMTWMQISPVAIAANLFQESQLVPLLESGTLPLDQLPPRFLPVGYLPSDSSSDSPSAGSPAVGTAWRSPELQTLWQSLTAGISPPSTPNDPPDLPLRSLPSAQPPMLQWLQTKTQQLKQLPEKLASDILEKTGLIYSPSSLPAEFTTPATDLDRTNPAQSDATPSDWLTMEDLFGGIPIQVRQSNAVDRPSRTTTPSTSQTSATSATLSVVESPAADNASPTFTPPWIEAEVKLVRYEKHPLEQLLQWLDNGMVWIETKLTQAWQWMRDRF